MATAAAATNLPAASSKSVDESLWWDSFVSFFEELDAAPLSSDLPDHLVKKVKSNHAWFLDSVTRFKTPNSSSKNALDSSQIYVGSHRLDVKLELKEAALRISSCLCIDEVQSYILVKRFSEHSESVTDVESQEFLHSVLFQYYYERQCLLKCIRRIFVHALCLSNASSSSDAIVAEALQLGRDGLGSKLLSILTDLLSSANSEKSEADFTILWVEESVIEYNLILDTLFLLYYDNFYSCSCQQWKQLCSILKDTLCGSYNIGKLVASPQARTSFEHAKAQLLLILIETLDLENLLRMVHDEVPFRKFSSVFSLNDILEMDLVVSSISGLAIKEVGLLLLVWSIYICLLLSLPERTEYSLLMEIDHVVYLRHAFEAASFDYVLEFLRSDALKDSDGPISGYLSVLRTVIAAFIASYELNHQTAENTLNLILDILCEIYHGEDSLSMQFWDRDSIIDGPIRSLLYMLESEYPFRTVELVRLLSALCTGTWSAECVYNFLEKMTCITLLSEVSGSSEVVDSYYISVAPNQLDVPYVEGLVIPKGTHGQILKLVDANIALVRWEFAHSGLFLLLLRLTQKSTVCGFEEVSAILDLFDRMISFNMALSFSMLFLERPVPVQASQEAGTTIINVRIDLVKTICTLAFSYMQDVSNSGVVSTCIHMLSEILKCAPSHVTEVVSKSNIFGAANNGSSSTWLPFGGLARMLMTDCKETGDLFQLTTSVLDFTFQLMEKSGDDDLATALVVFSLQYVLVNHMHWKYSLKLDRWTVTLKLLEVMKSCTNAIQADNKLGLMVRNILFFDSSVHCILCQILCMSPTELEKPAFGCRYILKEIEDLQLAVCCGLEVVNILLADFLKGTFSKLPTFIQTMLSSGIKPVPVVKAAATWIKFFENSAIQVAAGRVLSKLCVVASRVQQYRNENVSFVIDAMQVNDLHRTIFRILDEQMEANEDLVTTVLDLLTSAASYQPNVLVSLIFPEEDMEVVGTNYGSGCKQLQLAATSKPTFLGGENSLDLILKYVKRSEVLFESVPRLLLSLLNFLKALWDGGVQYLRILEKIRSSEMFRKHLFSILAIELKVDLSAESVKVTDAHCNSYRYLCQSTLLDILARELFLSNNLTPLEIPGKGSGTGHLKEQNGNRSSTGRSKSSNDILSTCLTSSTVGNLVTSYSSSVYDKEIIFNAKMAVCMCIVHLIVRLSTGSAGSMCISLVKKIMTISKKLSEHPAFSALLVQYSSRGYSNDKEVAHLVLNDLYYHMQGELEGRQITQGPFQELSHFLLQLEIFQNIECKYEEDERLPAIIVGMFDISQVRAELGLEAWEHSGWKESIEVAENMLLHMHHANLITSLSISKCLALQSLVAILSVLSGNLQVSRMSDGAFFTSIESSITYVCKCLQKTEDSLIPALNPSEILLKTLSAQTELLLVLCLILFRQSSEKTSRKKYLPLSLLLMRTSGSGIKFLAEVRVSFSVLNQAVKSFLTLLLTSTQFIYPKSHAEVNTGLEADQFAEASFTCTGLLPILCKHAEHSEFCDLSVASIDLMLKGFLAVNTWLPILENHLQLRHILQRIQQKEMLFSIPVTLNFLLTLAHTRSGAQMLYCGSIFSSLKVLIDYVETYDSFSTDLDQDDIPTIFRDDEMPAQLWSLSLAIITSMILSLGDDPSCIDIVEITIHYLFYEKPYLLSYSLSVPSFPSHEPHKKRKQDKRTSTSLTSLKMTENFLVLVCVLAGHQAAWSKGMKEKESELRETCIHLLAFISKMPRVTDSSNKLVPLFCSPAAKEELILNEQPSSACSKYGWFRLCTPGLPARMEAPVLSSGERAVTTKDQTNGNDMAHQSQFSDKVAMQIYKIAFLLLKFLCMQAKAAAKRAEELELIDLAYFPELPMPEILHGLQDQAISIVADVCRAHKERSMEPETEGLCLLLLQILEKALYLEFCVSKSCGICPVLGRIEIFSKEIKLLMQVVEQQSKFRVSVMSLRHIISLVYPGLFRVGSLI